MYMHYDVEADWILLKTCNLQCKYCFFPHHELNSKIVVSGTSAQWLEGFNATGKTWLLHITGGEPSLYPGFVDLCAHLTRNHFISINSNLLHESIDAFTEIVDPKRVHFINAALHYDARIKKSSIEIFINRVHRLKMHNFTVFVSLVMTPEIVIRYPKIAEYFESRGISIIPKVMHGHCMGNKYPTSYSPGEKTRIHDYLLDAQRLHAPVFSKMDNPPTINPLDDVTMVNGLKRYYGKMCASGETFVRIEPDGTVFRCSSRIRLGNILQKKVNFLRFPTPCYSSYCQYFCEKYTAKKFVPEREGHFFPYFCSLMHFFKLVGIALLHETTKRISKKIVDSQH